MDVLLWDPESEVELRLPESLALYGVSLRQEDEWETYLAKADSPQVHVLILSQGTVSEEMLEQLEQILIRSEMQNKPILLLLRERTMARQSFQDTSFASRTTLNISWLTLAFRTEEIVSMVRRFLGVPTPQRNGYREKANKIFYSLARLLRL